MTLLFRYIFKRFCTTFIGLSSGLILLVFIIDSLETAYRLARREGTQPLDAIGLSLLKMPGLFEEILPFAVLLTAVLVYRRLSLDSEVDVIRSIGLSAWRFLSPAVSAAILISIFAVTLLNPAAVRLNAIYEIKEDIAKGEVSDDRSIIQSNSWIRDKVDDKYYLITLGNVLPISYSKDQFRVLNGNIRIQDEESHLLEQFIFKKAHISDEQWELSHIEHINYETGKIDYFENLTLTTNLPASSLIERTISAEFLTFWQLPKNMRILRESGLNTSLHRLYFLNKLSMPILYTALCIIGAILALRPSRRGGGIFITAASIASGFAIWSFSSIVFSLGLEGNMPPIAAAWLPAIIAIMISLTLILYREDG